MKKLLVTIVIVLAETIAPMQTVSAQDPITLIIKEGITKAIKAVDLQIQRSQNETIWLQNAQKVVENAMTQAKLAEISDWVEKQRTLYKDYFEELWKVKNAIAMYHRIKEVTTKQIALVNEYKNAFSLFKMDANFNQDEIGYMGKFYTGLIDESVKNLEQLFLVVNSFSTQMSDAKRLEIINSVADKVDKHYNDLKAFNNESIMLSVQRAKTKHEVDTVKELYGLR
ncbi:MAG: conjugal transfer protein TraI [Segetibacter sp.]|nr:conjugal transfer protein TraI [Segetibacter sp.]